MQNSTIQGVIAFCVASLSGRFSGMTESNATMNSSNGSTENIFNQITVPLHVSYYKLLISSLAMFLIIPTISVAVIIFKNKKLRSKKIFLINLLVADVGTVLFGFLKNIVIIILYLTGFSIDVDCRLIHVPIIAAFMAAKLMFIPMSIDQFIHVAFPFKYKRIMTTKVKKIIASFIWLFTISMSVLVVIGMSAETIPALAACSAPKRNFSQLLPIVMPMVLSIIIIAATSIYLRYRIIKSNRFFHSIKRSASQHRKAIMAGKLVEKLLEQTKPTVSVFIVGGIDGVFNLLFVIISLAEVFVTITPLTYLYIIEFVWNPILICQIVSHALSYGIYNDEVRHKLFNCRRPCSTTRSKVIVLNRQ